MSGLRLTVAQRRKLERQLRTTHDAGLYRRTLAILEAADGRPVAEIARLLRISRVSVYRWIERYDCARDPTCLVDSRGGNHPSVWTEELQAALSDGLGQRPDHFGYQAVEWDGPPASGAPGPLWRRTPIPDLGPSAVARPRLRLETAAIRVGTRPRAREKNGGFAGQSGSCRPGGSSGSRMRRT